MNGTPVWEVLASKAQRAVREAQQKLAEVQLRREQAIEREKKIDELLVEYSDRLTSIQQRAHSTDEAGNYRKFIVQLQTIKSRSTVEFQNIEMAFTEARREMLLADQERLKVEHLVKRAKEQRQQELEQLDSREAETQSMIQFNLRARLQR